MASTQPDSLGDASLYILLWMLLPGILTEIVQSTYYRFKYSSSSAAPQPGSHKYKRHHRTFYVIVVGSYLLFCVFQVFFTLPPNFYSEYSLPTGASLKEVRTKFKKFSLQYHPDKNPSPEAEATFIKLKKIYDTLTNPVSKEAYCKFGAERINACSHCIIFKDYIYASTTEAIANYIASGIVLFLYVIFNSGFSQYYRVVAYFSLMVLEANMLFLPYDPISWFLPNLTISEKLIVLHQWGIYIFMALNHFGPLFMEDPVDDAAIAKTLAQLNLVTESVERQIKKNLKADLGVFNSDPEKFTQLTQQMEKIAANEKLT